jgi:hypothetical protein
VDKPKEKEKAWIFRLTNILRSSLGRDHVHTLRGDAGRIEDFMKSLDFARF